MKILTAIRQSGMMVLTAEYYYDAGVACWVSNKHPVPLDAARDYGIAIEEALQKKAITKHAEEFMAEYRKNPPQFTDELLYELRAAFGEGEVVVDIVTGRKIRV